MPRALVLPAGSLGDTLVSLPASREIRRRYPAHRLTLLTESQPAGSGRVSPWTILKETGWFDDVHFYVVRARRPRTLAQPGVGGAVPAAGYHDIFSLAPPRTDGQLRVDAWIFRGVARRQAIPRGAVAPRGPRGPSTRRPSNTKASPAAHRRSRGDRRCARRFSSRGSGADLALGRGLLDDLGVRPDSPGRRGPGSGRSSTAWPAERFAAVGNALLQQFQDVVLLAMGGSGERALCEQLCAAWGPRSHNLAGRLSVFGSASVLSHARPSSATIGPDASRGDGGDSLVAIFSARNASRPLAAARAESRRPRRAAGMRRLHARRLRARSEEVPDPHPDRPRRPRGGVTDRVARRRVPGDLRRTTCLAGRNRRHPHRAGGCTATAGRRLRSAEPEASLADAWSIASLRSPADRRIAQRRGLGLGRADSDIVFHFAAQTSTAVAAENPDGDFAANVAPMRTAGRLPSGAAAAAGDVRRDRHPGRHSNAAACRRGCDRSPVTVYDRHKLIAEAISRRRRPTVVRGSDAAAGERLRTRIARRKQGSEHLEPDDRGGGSR